MRMIKKQPAPPLPLSNSSPKSVPRPQTASFTPSAFDQIIQEGELIEVDHQSPSAFVVRNGSVEAEMRIVSPQGVFAIKLDTVERGHYLHLSAFFGSMPKDIESSFRFRAKSRVVLVPFHKDMLPKNPNALREFIYSLIKAAVIREYILRQLAACAFQRSEEYQARENQALSDSANAKTVKNDKYITELEKQIRDLRKRIRDVEKALQHARETNESLSRALQIVQDENHALTQACPPKKPIDQARPQRFPSAMKFLAVQDPNAETSASGPGESSNNALSSSPAARAESPQTQKVVKSPDGDELDEMIRDSFPDLPGQVRPNPGRIDIPPPSVPQRPVSAGNTWASHEPDSGSHATLPYKPGSDQCPAAADLDIPPPGPPKSVSGEDIQGNAPASDPDSAAALTYAAEDPAGGWVDDINDLDELEELGPAGPSETVSFSSNEDPPDVEAAPSDIDAIHLPGLITDMEEILEGFRRQPAISLDGPPIPGPPPALFGSHPKPPNLPPASQPQSDSPPDFTPSQRIYAPSPGSLPRETGDMDWADDPLYSTTQTYQSPILSPKQKK